MLLSTIYFNKLMFNFTIYIILGLQLIDKHFFFFFFNGNAQKIIRCQANIIVCIFYLASRRSIEQVPIKTQ